MSNPGDSDPNLVFRRAISLQQSGQVAQAAALCRQLLRRYAPHPPILNLLGTAELQLGNIEAGVALLGKSLAMMPNQPDMLANLGAGLQKLGRPEEALTCFDRLVALTPGNAEAWYRRGGILFDLERYPQALECCDRVVAVDPGDFPAHCGRGDAFRALGRPEEALAAYDRALAIRPDDAKIVSNRSNILLELGRPEEALTGFDRAAAIDPGLIDIRTNRAKALTMLNRFEEALADSDYSIAHGRATAEAFNNRGSALAFLGRTKEAMESYDRAIAIDPANVNTCWNKALLALLTGDFSAGWKLFEWRWKTPQLSAISRDFVQPQWTGDKPIAGKTVLVYAEQGYGDTVQFCRYLPMLAALEAKVLFVAPSVLLPLLSTLKGDCVFIAAGGKLPDFDLHCPAMSLPLAFGTTLEAVPAEVPYLFADPDRQKAWRGRLGPKTRPRVGLAWSGNPGRVGADARRSIPAAQLAPLLMPQFEFHCLQKDIRLADADALAAFPQVAVHADELNDFADTAALIAEMDLIVAADTSAVHIAGALGKPVWILLPFVPDWRWLLGRTDSPWYPTARLFRQPSAGDWASVVGEAAETLRHRA